MPDLEYRFPEAFLEIGKDDDHSYNSLRTTRQSDGRLKIDVERWGIAEHGLFLGAGIGTRRVLELRIMGHCGSVFSETWIKTSFSRVVEKEEEEKAQQIEYCGWAPVEVGQIKILLGLPKLPYPKS
jgi:hypothetical protein